MSESISIQQRYFNARKVFPLEYWKEPNRRIDGLDPCLAMPFMNEYIHGITRETREYWEDIVWAFGCIPKWREKGKDSPGYYFFPDYDTVVLIPTTEYCEINDEFITWESEPDADCPRTIYTSFPEDCERAIKKRKSLWRDAIGCAPGICGDKTPEQFIRDLRDKNGQGEF